MFSGKRLFLILASSLALAGCTNPLANLSLSKKSGLQVTSIPQATVFLDGKSLGTTPVREENLTPGEHAVKLTPSDPSLQPYEASVKLTSGVLTAVDRTLAASPSDAHGFTLSFEPLSNKHDVLLDVTSSPDSVTFTVDGTPQGFTPRSLDSITAGDHTILFSSPGYIDKTVRAKTVEGYRLIIDVQLAKAPVPVLPSPEATPSATPSVSITPTTKPTVTVTPQASNNSYLTKPYVQILETPTGWLRVRTEPPGGTELGKVNSGDTFKYLQSSEAPNAGWYEIEYETGKNGWVSSQYAKLVQ